MNQDHLEKIMHWIFSDIGEFHCQCQKCADNREKTDNSYDTRIKRALEKEQYEYAEQLTRDKNKKDNN